MTDLRQCVASLLVFDNFDTPDMHDGEHQDSRAHHCPWISSVTCPSDHRPRFDDYGKLQMVKIR